MQSFLVRHLFSFSVACFSLGLYQQLCIRAKLGIYFALPFIFWIVDQCVPFKRILGDEGDFLCISPDAPTLFALIYSKRHSDFGTRTHMQRGHLYKVQIFWEGQTICAFHSNIKNIWDIFQSLWPFQNILQDTHGTTMYIISDCTWDQKPAGVYKSPPLKFIYSEKGTSFCKISTIDFSCVVFNSQI